MSRGVSNTLCGVCCSEKGVEDEEDLYDCVYDDEDGGEIYEDLMKTEAVPPPVSTQLSDSTHSFTTPRWHRLTQFDSYSVAIFIKGIVWHFVKEVYFPAEWKVRRLTPLSRLYFNEMWSYIERIILA